MHYFHYIVIVLKKAHGITSYTKHYSVFLQNETIIHEQESNFNDLRRLGQIPKPESFCNR